MNPRARPTGRLPPTRNVQSKEYWAWLNIHQRCTNPKSVSYSKYGALGITVDPVWRKRGSGFLRFLADVGYAPSREHSLDRINPFGNYGPGNCRWATPTEQARNKKTPWKGGFDVFASEEQYLRTKAHSAWKNMRRRCLDPRDPAYQYYGARGVGVCMRWQKSFAAFIKDLGLPPSRKHSLDRVNSRLCYSPANCHWATSKEQALHRRSTIMLTYKGRTLCASDWARKFGVHIATFKYWYTNKHLTMDEMFKRSKAA